MKNKLIIYLGVFVLFFLVFQTVIRLIKVKAGGNELENFRISPVVGIIDFVDEGRGIITGLKDDKYGIRYKISCNLLRMKGASDFYPYYRIGDSIFKKGNNDTFTIVRRGEFYVYIIPK